MSFEEEADREYAYVVGSMNPQQAWILSNRDVWYKNPFYDGPPVRHPEDDTDAGEDMPITQDDSYVWDNDYMDDVPF